MISKVLIFLGVVRTFFSPTNVSPSSPTRKLYRDFFTVVILSPSQIPGLCQRPHHSISHARKIHDIAFNSSQDPKQSADDPI